MQEGWRGRPRDGSFVHRNLQDVDGKGRAPRPAAVLARYATTLAALRAYAGAALGDCVRPLL